MQTLAVVSGAVLWLTRKFDAERNPNDSETDDVHEFGRERVPVMPVSMLAGLQTKALSDSAFYRIENDEQANTALIYQHKKTYG